MGVRAVLLSALLLCLGIADACAAVRINGDRGGRIGTYMQVFAMLRSSGETVVIDGPCLSACTLILGILPSNQVCVTSRARLGFHAAWRPDHSGRPITSSMGTQVLMEIYPPKVRRWIKRKGGLSRRMIFLAGKELATFYPRCRASR